MSTETPAAGGRSELLTALEILKAAEDRVARIRQRQPLVDERWRQAAEARHEAKAALGRAAGSFAAGDVSESAVTLARASLVDAEAANEVASLECEGLANIVVTAEREADAAARQVRALSAAAAVERNAMVERRILVLADELRELLGQHRGLARHARAMATNDRGYSDEPIPYAPEANLFGSTVFTLKLKQLMSYEADQVSDVERIERHYSTSDFI